MATVEVASSNAGDNGAARRIHILNAALDVLVVLGIPVRGTRRGFSFLWLIRRERRAWVRPG
jgi:hypothetical protein